jgi:hypothetical protein
VPVPREAFQRTRGAPWNEAGAFSVETPFWVGPRYWSQSAADEVERRQNPAAVKTEATARKRRF